MFKCLLKRKAYMRRYMKIYNVNYKKTHKNALKNYNIKYNRTKKGVLMRMFATQRAHCKLKSRPLPTYTLQYLYDRFLNDKFFNKLYLRWVRSGFKKKLKPSIDRIDAAKDYTISNIQLMTWGENELKGRYENNVYIKIHAWDDLLWTSQN